MNHRTATIEALVKAYGGEALFRPSSADRTMNCYGSVRLVATLPRVEQAPTVYQAEGTAAHFIAEQALIEAHEPEEWLDRTFLIDAKGVSYEREVRPLHVRVPVTQDMLDGVDAYLETIALHWRPGVQQYVEHKLSLAALDPNDPLLHQNRGTADCIHLDYEHAEIDNFDLKFGRGVMVSAKTPQLKNYALMTLFTFAPPKGGWRKVTLHIEQPRASDPAQRRESVEYDPNELVTDFAGDVVGAMEAALDPEPMLTPGPWCRWCPASVICPALQNSAFDFQGQSNRNFKAGDALTALPEHVFIGSAVQPEPREQRRDMIVLPDSGVLDGSTTARILDRLHLFETWAAGVRHRAVMLLQTGSDVPGWKLGRRTGRLRWKDSKTAPTALGEAGLNGLYKSQLKTPKQLAKMATPEQQKIIDTLAERPQGDVILVPADAAKQEIFAVLGPINDENDE